MGSDGTRSYVRREFGCKPLRDLPRWGEGVSCRSRRCVLNHPGSDHALNIRRILIPGSIDALQGKQPFVPDPTMSLEQLISTYGYAAITAGVFLEGETMLVLGGLAAQRGYLALPWVLVSAFWGSVLGDQFFFYIGRFKGQRILEKRQDWKSKSERVFSLLNRHQVLLIFGFRFLYGLRMATPIVLGVSRIAPLRFLLLDMAGALVWTLVIGAMGYLFGHALEALIGDVKRYELWLFIGVAALGALARAVSLILRK